MRDRFKMRPVTMNDLGDIVDLANTASLTDLGKPETSLEKKRAELESGDIDIERDCRIVHDGSGLVTGYIELWNSPPYTRPTAWGCVHPEYCGLGIGSSLVTWAQTHAGSMTDKAPAGKRVAFQVYSPASNHRALRMFSDNGLSRVRCFLRMRIDMEKETRPDAPILPDGILIRPFRPGIEEKPLYRTMQEAFSDHWDHVDISFETWLDSYTTNFHYDPTALFIAVDNRNGQEEIIGGSLCYPATSEEDGCAYVEDLGVLKPWRRRGIALALLQHTFREFHGREIYSVELYVDSENPTGATGLYEKAGMRTVRRTDLYEREIRSGKD